MNYRETTISDVSIVTVTSEIAKKMLEKNKENRAVNKARVTQYSKAMQEGRWIENGQPVILSSDGFLVDGQHRLNAIIKADATIEMLVVTLKGTDGKGELTARNIPIDIGQSRTVANITGLHPRVASIVRQMVWMFEEGGQAISKDPEIIMQRYEKMKDYLEVIPKKNLRTYSNIYILATLVMADFEGYEVWPVYNDLLNRNYHLLPEVWSSWMRNIENGETKRGVDKEKYFIANTWRLAKSKGKTRVIVKDIEGELSECRAVYRRMIK